MSQSTKGRPAGSRTKNSPEAAVELSRCSKCGSTERAAYSSKHEQAYSGLDGFNQPFTHIIRSRTHCLCCGQHRVDRTLENRLTKRVRNPGEVPPEDPRRKL